MKPETLCKLHLHEAGKVGDEQGPAGLRHVLREHRPEDRVQGAHGAGALRGQRQVLGRDGLEARDGHRARAQHQLAHAAVEGLHLNTDSDQTRGPTSTGTRSEGGCLAQGTMGLAG